MPSVRWGVGRKNRLFSDSPDGARASTVIFTVLETAKANGLNPEKYIRHLLTVLTERFAHDSKAQSSDLLPWDVAPQVLCHA